ncbi:uncharacterized protein BDZ99DRAFT_546446 [Mytilinidion resinicola]|uniref:Nephrocystin 3-like N-terminal domain-containing protein n=1 Tax=Mytilinidion resinicola TaxID=574789 RepID=A0A6A6Y5Q7_9PEZI|nr:uncharacterized protein BDZ99DRAFT_546446 [Mytilinidion resinicola]KAF2803858.1 hypothetical protein BDZ99DRAFT_546446 [Mytilinidion resinicola]
MAEAIGLVANVIAVIQISETVIKVCKFYIESLHDAPSDLRAMLIEVSTLKTILENLQFLLTCGIGVGLSKVLNTYNLFGVDGPIEGCKKTVEKIEGLFPAPTSGSSKVRSAFAALAWPLKESKARKLLTDLVQYKTTISLAITTDSSQDIKEIKKMTTELHTILTESQRNEIYKWLGVTDPSPLHHRAVKQFEPQTGDWMLRSPEWRDWIDGRNRCLWIHGIPGAGKTVLASHLIENIKGLCENRGSRRCAYAYYYCYFGHNQDEAAPFLRWTLNRLCREAETIPACIYKIFKKGEQPSVVDLLNALESVLDEFDTVYLFTDAIDESMPREDLLKILRDLSTDPRFKKIQLLAMSRQYIDIEGTMQNISVPVSMSNPLLDEDIRLFRWAVCQIDALQRLKPESRIIRNALQNLPRTLDETYERIFTAIPHEDRIFLRLALQWIWFQGWLYDDNISIPLLLQAIEHSMPESDPSDMELCYDQEVLREICGCLIMVTESKKFFDTVSFAHYTVKEFLESPRILTSPANVFAIKEKHTSLELMRTTLLEVTQNPEYDTWDPSDELDEFIHFNTFCNIASLNGLEDHGKELAEDANLVDLMFKLLDTSQPHFQKFADILHNREIADQTGYYGDFPFWDITWNSPPSTSGIAPLISLLTWIDGFEDPKPIGGALEVAKKFMRKVDIKALLESVVDVGFLEKEFKEHFQFQFQGSIVEYFACFGYSETHRAFWFLMEHAADFINPSQALLTLLSSHIECVHHDRNGDSEENCPLARILQLGASTNVPGYKVTPLQIAVNCLDLVGVKILLEAGADVNGIGDGKGVDWNEGTSMSIFNRLHGMRPLEIVQGVDWNESTSMSIFKPLHGSRSLESIQAVKIMSPNVVQYFVSEEEWGEEEWEECKEKKIERILVQYGATSNTPATTTESVRMEEG